MAIKKMNAKEALSLISYVKNSYNTENFVKGSYTAQQWFSVVEEALREKVEHDGRTDKHI